MRPGLSSADVEENRPSPGSWLMLIVVEVGTSPTALEERLSVKVDMMQTQLTVYIWL